MNTETTHDADSSNRNTLVGDLQRLLAEADNLLTDVSDATVEDFSAACTKVEIKLAEARAKIFETQTNAAGKTRCAVAATRHFIKHNPVQLAGIAVLAGLIAGFLFARR
jgi:ElaB/YqjD/DUF883 family membrane-anchored ribosome-binding protein